MWKYKGCEVSIQIHIQRTRQGMTTMEELMKLDSIGMQGRLLLRMHYGEFMASILVRMTHLSCNFNFIYQT
jgi:hypothetical protein